MKHVALIIGLLLLLHSGTGCAIGDTVAPDPPRLIMGMPVVPGGGWANFNTRAVIPEDERSEFVRADVTMTIELDASGRPISIEHFTTPDYPESTLWHSAVNAVYASRFVAVDSRTSLDALRFVLVVGYERSARHGVVRDFDIAREEMPILNILAPVGLHHDWDEPIPLSRSDEFDTAPKLIGGRSGLISSMGFPYHAKIAGLRDGWVVVAFTVTTDGRADDIEFLYNPGYGFDDEVLAALRRARFQSATLRGEPVPVRSALSINFSDSAVQVSLDQ